jgi:antitoxin MazE
MKVTVAKWGNSLGLRLPKQLVDELGLAPGSQVELAREGTKLVAETSNRRQIPRYRLEDLVAEMKRLGGRDAEPETIEWGADVGSEIIDDAYSRGEITLEDILKKKNAP